MKKYFSNSVLFDIFKSNKRILLFLIEENVMIIDENIAKKMINGKYKTLKYPQYFSQEIKPFLTEEFNKKYVENINQDDEEDEDYDDDDDNEEEKRKKNTWIDDVMKELPENFYEKRKTGENDSFICGLIRKDSIDDFIVYVNKNCCSINSTIKPSIYETNPLFLMKNKITLIEYAVFYGSIEIFNYLRLNGAELTPSLWIYSIHGKNAEIIHLLEENHILPKDESYIECMKESIKCHHNDILNYIQQIYLSDDIEKSNDYLINCFKYYNFCFDIPKQNELIDSQLFYYLCKYDYYILVSNLIKEIDTNINVLMVYIDKYFNDI